jgi:hypothetical protein
VLFAAAIGCGAILCASRGLVAAQLVPANQESQSQQQNPPVDPAAQKSPDPASLPASKYAPRGKKLVMKDGSYQLVREYQKNGDIVRYYSVERSQWEEIPLSLVDWAATDKASVQEKNQAETLIATEEKREAQHKAAEVVDVDASLEVGPGMLLPPGEGLFVVAGKNITVLNEVRTNEKVDKGQAIKRALSPVPFISAKNRMLIPGKRADVRVAVHDPEFYMRIPYDSGDEPALELMRAEVKGDGRVVEVIKTNMAGEKTFERKTLSLQRWDVAQGVYRFTLGENLPAGEYVLAVILPEGINMYVWDFGVDDPPGNILERPHSFENISAH